MFGTSDIWLCVGILASFASLFILLLFGEYIYNLIVWYYEWLKPYGLIFLMFVTLIVLLYPDIFRMICVIGCEIVIIYAFRLTYRNKYIKGFKELPVPKDQPIMEMKPVDSIKFYSTDKEGKVTTHYLRR